MSEADELHKLRDKLDQIENSGGRLAIKIIIGFSCQFG
jgi:hypothetical protein